MKLKKIILYCFCLFVIFSLMGCEFINSHVFSQGELVYEFDSYFDGINHHYGYMVKDVKDDKVTDIKIPSDFNEYPIIGINEEAFLGCYNLKTIEIPNSVIFFDNNAFNDCELLEIVYYKGTIEDWNYVKINNSNSSPMNFTNHIYMIGESGKYEEVTEIVIPNGITEIPSYQFTGFNKVTSIKFPEGLKIIGESAFFGCESITDIVIPDSVTIIDNYAFDNCTNLKSIKLSNSLNKIGAYAFSYTNLKSIELPNNLKEIGNDAFSNTSLINIEIPQSVTSIGCDVLRGCDNLERLILPYLGDGKNDFYSNLDYTFGFRSQKNLREIKITGGTTIGEGAFEGYNSLTSIEISDSVTTISENAFYSCTNLERIVLPFVGDGKDETSLSYVFGNSIPDSLKTIKITGGTSIGKNAFAGFWKVDTIELPNTLKNIENNAFYRCSGLTSIVIPESVTSIGDYAFYDCSGLTSIVIPESVTSIGDYAFYDCSGLTSIVIPESVTSIGDYAFYDCSGLTSVAIQKSITSIGEFAFDCNCNIYYNGVISDWCKINFESPWCNPKSNVKGVYILDENKKYNEVGEFNEIILPNTITRIGNYSFSSFNSLKNVIIPNSVTSIGNGAFYNCDSLKSIEIPNSVTTIGFESFSGCNNLEKITLPFIGNGIDDTRFCCIFKKSYIHVADYPKIEIWEIPPSLKEVIITNATSIGEDAFSGCSNLTSIVIPESVTSIAKGSFFGCSSLESITLPFIGNGSDSNYFSYIFFDEYHLGIDDNLPKELLEKYEKYPFAIAFQLVPQSLKQIKITNEVSVSDYAFYNCSSLTNIILPEGVTSIGSHAFSGCESLTLIVIPESVTSIGSHAFSGCESLTSIVIPESVTSIGSYAFSGCESLASIVIPEGVTSIGSYAFSGCKNLTSIVIPERVTSIGESALYGCNKLTSISLPFTGYEFLRYIFKDIPTSLKKVIITSGTSIEDRAFYWCTNLTSIIIPESVTSIGSHAFSGCKSLSSLVIPKSVTSIGRDAFSDCNSLEKVYYKGTIGEWCNIEFYDIISNPIYYAKYIYMLDENNEYKEIEEIEEIKIPNTVTKIGDYQFYKFENLKQVEIPESVISIGVFAFRDCKSLSSIVIPESVTSIGYSAFSDCNSLEKVYYKGTIENWCNIKFNYITCNPIYYAKYIYMLDENNEYKEIEEIKIPNTVTKIGDYQFYKFENLKQVEIPESVTSIGVFAFKGCKNLTSIVIPESVTSIGESTFEYCTSLTSIVIPESVISIGNSAFEYCTSLTSIVIPESVTSIGEGAFECCKNLISIVIPESVTSIGDYAFSGCTSLIIYCEADSKPSGWSNTWNYLYYYTANSLCPVKWGYKK